MKFLVSRDEKTLYRERGFAAAYNRRPKQTEGFPTPEAQSAYNVGYRLGTRERERV